MGIHFTVMHPESSAMSVLMTTRMTRSYGMKDSTVVNCPAVQCSDGSMVR